MILTLLVVIIVYVGVRLVEPWIRILRDRYLDRKAAKRYEREAKLPFTLTEEGRRRLNLMAERDRHRRGEGLGGGRDESSQ